MRPNKECIKIFLPTLGETNVFNAVEDFEEITRDFFKVSPPLVNMLWTTFVMGMLVVMNPKSNFNKKYKAG